MQPAIHIVIGALLGNLVSQVIKYIIGKAKGQKRKIIGDGGMPSSHSSTVAALLVMIYLVEGITAVFALAFVLACIVIHDSLNIRREVGRHAKQLNKLAKKQFKVDTGHNVSEVIVGIIAGAAVAFVYASFL